MTKEEYELNFGEKKNFLKSLIFLIFKGNAMPSKIEDMIVNQNIVEFNDAFFHPFNGFSDDKRHNLRQKLLTNAKMDEEYDKYERDMESIDEQIRKNGNNGSASNDENNNHALLLPSEVRRLKLIRQCRSLTTLFATETEYCRLVYVFCQLT